MEFLTAPREDLIRLIYDLIEENKFLKTQIAELKADKETPKQDEKKQPPFFVNIKNLLLLARKWWFKFYHFKFPVGHEFIQLFSFFYFLFIFPN